MIKKLFGIQPKYLTDGSYSPSKLSLFLATNAKTDFDGGNYDLRGSKHNKKILVVCTEKEHMRMKNGKNFLTGNHPVEMFVPILHFKKGGYKIDFATPTGKGVKIEKWAMPNKDQAVMNLYHRQKYFLDNPMSFTEIIAEHLTENSKYQAIFIPGGHGAMLGLPENQELGKILLWFHETQRFTLSICHGPAALLAINLITKNKFIYDKYKIAAFPDKVDAQTPYIGYMPGHMPWQHEKKLKELGAIVVNKKADKTCQVDRQLITGASPKASNNFGRLATITLLRSLKSILKHRDT